MTTEMPATDIVPQLAIWIQQLRAIAQTGLAFDPPPYDRERYEAILALSAKMAATINSHLEFDSELADAFTARWRSDIAKGMSGYVTPKVGTGSIVFNDKDEILLIQRPEGGWLFPTGWADIGYSPAQIAAKEVMEETGLIVTPQHLIGVYDSARWRANLDPEFYSLLFYCRLDGGTLAPHPVETRGAGFFPLTALPNPLLRTSTGWVEHAWACHQGKKMSTFFDS